MPRWGLWSAARLCGSGTFRRRRIFRVESLYHRRRKSLELGPTGIGRQDRIAVC